MSCGFGKGGGTGLRPSTLVPSLSVVCWNSACFLQCRGVDCVPPPLLSFGKHQWSEKDTYDSSTVSLRGHPVVPLVMEAPTGLSCYSDYLIATTVSCQQSPGPNMCIFSLQHTPIPVPSFPEVFHAQLPFFYLSKPFPKLKCWNLFAPCGTNTIQRQCKKHT